MYSESVQACVLHVALIAVYFQLHHSSWHNIFLLLEEKTEKKTKKNLNLTSEIIFWSNVLLASNNTYVILHEHTFSVLAYQVRTKQNGIFSCND